MGKRKRKKKRKKLTQKQTKLFLRPQKRPHWRSKKLSISTSWHIFEIFGSFQALQHRHQPDAACTGALKNSLFFQKYAKCTVRLQKTTALTVKKALSKNYLQQQ